MTQYKELTGEKREKFKKWLKQFQKENDRSPTIEEVYEEATKTVVVEHFEAYGQCRDSRRIAELEAQIEKMKSALIDIKSNTDDVNIEWQIKYLFDELEIKEND